MTNLQIKIIRVFSCIVFLVSYFLKVETSVQYQWGAEALWINVNPLAIAFLAVSVFLVTYIKRGSRFLIPLILLAPFFSGHYWTVFLSAAWVAYREYYNKNARLLMTDMFYLSLVTSSILYESSLSTFLTVLGLLGLMFRNNHESYKETALRAITLTLAFNGTSVSLEVLVLSITIFLGLHGLYLVITKRTGSINHFNILSLLLFMSTLIIGRSAAIPFALLLVFYVLAPKQEKPSWLSQLFVLPLFGLVLWLPATLFGEIINLDQGVLLFLLSCYAIMSGNRARPLKSMYWIPWFILPLNIFWTGSLSYFSSDVFFAPILQNLKPKQGAWEPSLVTIPIGLIFGVMIFWLQNKINLSQLKESMKSLAQSLSQTLHPQRRAQKLLEKHKESILEQLDVDKLILAAVLCIFLMSFVWRLSAWMQ